MTKIIEKWCSLIYRVMVYSKLDYSMGIHIYLVSLTDLHDIFPDVSDGRDSSVLFID